MNMLKPLYAIAIIYCSCLIPPTFAAEDGDGKTSLWKIDSDSNTVYMLGSIHILKEDEYPLNERIDSVFNAVNTIVFETNLDSMDSPEIRGYFMSRAQYSDGDEHNLSTELSKETYRYLESKLDSMGLVLANYNTFRPWFLSMTLTLRKLILLGFNPNYGVDQYYLKKAVAAGKEVMGFETPVDHINILYALSNQSGEDMLMQTIEEYDSTEVMIDRMVTAWRSGDLETIDKTINNSLSKYPDLHKSLIVDRNIAWMEKITRFLNDTEDYLIIVGTGHFPGEQGLIRLLEKNGYTVIQL